MVQPIWERATLTADFVGTALVLATLWCRRRATYDGTGQWQGRSRQRTQLAKLVLGFKFKGKFKGKL